MKHSELKRKVKKLGLEAIKHNEGVDIIYEGSVVAWVSKDLRAVMKIFYSFQLSEELRVKLLDILAEYSRTSVEDREDEKKYFIYPIRTRGERLVRFNGSFCEYGYDDWRSFGTRSGEPMHKYETVEFTELEAKEICEYFGWDFNKVAVEVDDGE